MGEGRTCGGDLREKEEHRRVVRQEATGKGQQHRRLVEVGSPPMRIRCVSGPVSLIDQKLSKGSQPGGHVGRVHYRNFF
jgi:hypothetical protein